MSIVQRNKRFKQIWCLKHNGWFFGLRNRPNRGKELERKSLEQLENYDSITELCGALGISEADLKSTPRYAPPISPLSNEGTKPCLGPRPGTQWSDESEGLLRKLWREGLPKREIAKRLGRSYQAVEAKASDLNLPRRGRIVGASKVTLRDTGDTENNFRQECEESNARYVQAVLDAGGGSWSGYVSANAAGSSR